MSAPRLPHRSRLMLHAVLRALPLAAALWLLVPGVASAHAHLVQADPAPDSVIAHAPSVASFVFWLLRGGRRAETRRLPRRAAVRVTCESLPVVDSSSLVLR